MNQEYFQYEIEKNTQTQTQLNQLKQLKTNLKKIKKLKFGIIADSMIIEENSDSFIFKFVEISQDVELGQGKNFDAVFFGEENEKFKILRYYKIIELINLAITLSQYRIHLPMLNCQHFILGSDQRESQIYITKRFYLGYFITDVLKRDNEEIVMNKNVPQEIKDLIGTGQNIEFDEKMTVYSLGCIICYMHTQKHLIDIDLEQIQDNQLRELIEKCKDISPDDRPTLVELKHKYLLILISEQILDLGIQEKKKFLIEGFINVFIAPYEQITGRLCVMEFFTKINFVSQFFSKMIKGNHYQQKESQLQSDTLIYLLVKEELAKLKLDNNQELSQWDQDNTKDEVDEFKRNYLQNYTKILQEILDIIRKKNTQILIQQISHDQVRSNDKIREMPDQLKEIYPELKSSFICLKALNKVFIYKNLLECFKPIQNKFIKENAYRRYDIILNELCSNKEIIVDEININNIQQKI